MIHASGFEFVTAPTRAIVRHVQGARTSEFGRRVAENGAAGTDHGTAGPVFLAGSKLRPGLAGPYPSLTDLVDGDLKMTCDFRRVYATVLEQWLGLSSLKTLGGQFELMPVFRADSG